MDPSDTGVAIPSRCQQCDRPLKSLVVCGECHTVNPAAQELDHFTFFGLSRRFDIDEEALQKRFIAIIRDIHPDFHGHSSPEFQALAVRLSAQANEAYKVLMDPLLRAEYLLQQAGGPDSTENKGVPDGFLPQIMMLREEIEEAKVNDDKEELQALAGQIGQRYESLAARIAELAMLVAESPDAQTRERLRVNLNAMTYIRNLREQVAS
jgi:molecular chaperone HscB